MCVCVVCVHMCVCICVCAYVCVHAHAHARANVYVHACIRIAQATNLVSNNSYVFPLLHPATVHLCLQHMFLPIQQPTTHIGTTFSRCGTNDVIRHSL